MKSHSLKLAALVILVCLLSPVSISHAFQKQHMEELLSRKLPVDRLLQLSQLFQNKSQLEEALQFCEELLENEPDNHDMLRKAAYLHYRLGWLYANRKGEKKDHYQKFYAYAKRAKRIQPDDYHTSFMLVAAKAKNIRFMSPGDQVRSARELAVELQGLLAQDMENIDILYLLSWLNFEIGRVPTYKRVLAAVLFGGLPEGMTIEKGFSLLSRVTKKRPGYLAYSYDLGLYYMLLENFEKAKFQFKKVLSMRPTSTEGFIYHHWSRGRVKQIEDLSR